MHLDRDSPENTDAPKEGVVVYRLVEADAVDFQIQAGGGAYDGHHQRDRYDEIEQRNDAREAAYRVVANCSNGHVFVEIERPYEVAAEDEKYHDADLTAAVAEQIVP